MEFGLVGRIGSLQAIIIIIKGTQFCLFGEEGGKGREVVTVKSEMKG